MLAGFEMMRRVCAKAMHFNFENIYKPNQQTSVAPLIIVVVNLFLFYVDDTSIYVCYMGDEDQTKNMNK